MASTRKERRLGKVRSRGYWDLGTKSVDCVRDRHRWATIGSYGMGPPKPLDLQSNLSGYLRTG